MDQLLAPWTYRRALSIYGRDDFKNATWQAFALYHYGTGFRLGPIERLNQDCRGQRCWSDAEEFLEELSAATKDSHRATALTLLWNEVRRHIAPGERDPLLHSIDKLEEAARCAVAASCCAFLYNETRDAVRGKERWQPYLRWFSHLGASDTLITFNYDRVIELLSDDDGNGVDVAGVSRPRPDPPGPSLLKLHGSTDWFQIEAGFGNVEDAFDRLVRLEPPLLAVPGPGKASLAAALFGTLWDSAASAVRSADQIFFLGYRFPKTDAFAGQRLLDALSENTTPRLRVFTCLGPDVRGGDSMRMIHLLHGARPKSIIHWEPESAPAPAWATTRVRQGIHPLPLWVEDLLASWARTMSQGPAQPASATFASDG